MKTTRITRRNFIQKTAVTSTLATLVPAGLRGRAFSVKPGNERSPREVWIAGVSQMGLHAFLHIWPAVQRFDEIQKKYGRNIRITNFHEEEWTVIESLSPEINVRDVLKEYNLKTHEELTADTEALQRESRK